MCESSYSLESSSNSSIKRSYKRVTREEKAALIQDVFEKKMTVTKAARNLGLNLSTAKVLVRNYRRELKARPIVEGRDSQEVSPSIISNASQASSTTQPQFYIFYIPTPMNNWESLEPFQKANQLGFSYP